MQKCNGGLLFGLKVKARPEQGDLFLRGHRASLGSPPGSARLASRNRRLIESLFTQLS